MLHCCLEVIDTMQKQKLTIVLLLSLLFTYTMLVYTFKEDAIFWYLYAFILLVGTATALVFSKFEDSMPTWQFLLYGIGFGSLTYALIRLGYIILPYIDASASKEISKFLATYGPTNIWHYLILIFIVAIGEEVFWRGYVQQQLKHFLSTNMAVLVASCLFSLSFLIVGFIMGAIAALIVGIIFGALYEWKKSMPLIIVAHLIFILLLFIILPFQ